MVKGSSTTDYVGAESTEGFNHMRSCFRCWMCFEVDVALGCDSV